jgi:hypothetical protein
MGFIILVGKQESFSSAMLNESLSLYFICRDAPHQNWRVQMKMQNVTVILSLSLTALLSGSVVAAPAGKSVVDVHYLDPGNTMVYDASSQLVRTDKGVSMTIDTNGLYAGAYTNWWVVFNNPGACENPIPAIGADCGLADLDLAAVYGSVLYATGNVVDEDGEGGFAGHLKVGDTGGALFGPGLQDSRGAEIHIVVRYHGPVIPAMMPAQIMTVGGGCGVYDCMDVQAAAHSPQ